MSTELGASVNPRKWRFTWEAQSHIPTLRLFIFDLNTKPSIECENLKVHLNLSLSLVSINWCEVATAEEICLRVPIPRVLIDAESPLSFRSLDDHIEVKLALLLPVDHPIISSFDSVLSISEPLDNAFPDSKPLVMESDQKLLSSFGGLHIYCRSCSVKLTRSPLRHFEEMPSVNWRDVADNWFGACCCSSFGRVSEKLVTSYANSYSCAKGACLLSSTTVSICVDDLLVSKFPALYGRPILPEPQFAHENGLSEATIDPKSDHGRVTNCDDSSERVHDCNTEVRFEGQNANCNLDLQCIITDNESVSDELVCILPVSKSCQDVTSVSSCCDHLIDGVLNSVDGDCINVVYKTSPMNQKPTKSMEVMENQNSFLNGFLGDVFMAKSFNLSTDVRWIDFVCPQCSSLLGAYPCGNGYVPVDGRVRLFKCYISACLPVGGSGDVFRKYTMERMFTNQLLESAQDELSFRTVIKDMKTKSPVLQIVLLNPNSWCCTGYCLVSAGDTIEQLPKLDLYPVVKVLLSDFRNDTKPQQRMIEDCLTKTAVDEVFMLTRQIEELIETLASAKDILPPAYTILQGLPLSSMRR